MYGPNDGPSKFISKLIKDFQLDAPNIPLTDGKQKRDFIYIDDVVNAFLIVLKKNLKIDFQSLRLVLENQLS